MASNSLQNSNKIWKNQGKFANADNIKLKEMKLITLDTSEVDMERLGFK